MTTMILDDMTAMTVTHAGDTLDQRDTMELKIEEVAILITKGQPRLVIQSTAEVPPRPSDPEGTETQRVKILVGSQGANANPYGNEIEEPPQQARNKWAMNPAEKWRSALEAWCLPGNTIKAYCLSATPFMVKSGNRSERVAYYECELLTTPPDGAELIGYGMTIQQIGGGETTLWKE